jgi:hypothetical protein
MNINFDIPLNKYLRIPERRGLGYNTDSPVKKETQNFDFPLPENTKKLSLLRA